MFKKIEDLSKPTLLNKSAVKDLRQGAINLFTLFEEIADDVIPKKAQLISCRLRSEYKQDIIANDDDIIFFTKEDLIIPHLRLLHQYPDLLPKLQVDKGGLKFIFEGSPVMCPGLTSPGGIVGNVPVGEIVGIYIEGKVHAVAIGIMEMSSEDILKINKGLAIKTIHHLGDALWQMRDLKNRK